MTLYVETQRADAAFNFAFEEYCMRSLAKGRKVLSIWQADHCVMLGRYQIAQKEINETLRRELNPQVVRRATGGGTIYTDMETLLYTVIMPIRDYGEMDFTRICAPFVRALNEIGVDATLGGRNDILIDGRKVSGNAQAVKRGCLCAHGSLLYNTDLDVLSGILQTDESKIKSKAISSMKSGVTRIADHIQSPPPVGIFWKRFRDAVLKQETEEVCEYCLTKTDIAEIEKIKTDKYDSWEWTYGSAPAFNLENEMRFPMGKLTVRMNIENGVIRECTLHGDFLGVTELSPLEALLSDCKYDPSALNERIGDTDLNPYLRGITKSQLLTCMFSG